MPRKSSITSVADEQAAPGGAAAVDRAVDRKRIGTTVARRPSTTPTPNNVPGARSIAGRWKSAGSSPAVVDRPRPVRPTLWLGRPFPSG